MRDLHPVTDVVARARNGEKQAWDALVEQYSPLIWSTCRRHRLGDADTQDVGQSVWRQLVCQLDKIRDPVALADWLATAARRECERRGAARGPQNAGDRADAGHLPGHETRIAEQELLMAKRHAALREAFTRLSPCCRQLIAMLVDEPPMPYTEISAELGILPSSIGSARSRCLEKLRRDPAIAALLTG